MLDSLVPGRQPGCVFSAQTATVVEFKASPLAFPGGNPGLFLHFKAEAVFSADRVEISPFSSAREEALWVDHGCFPKTPGQRQ